ncbi:MAG: acyl-CoA dehydrogenase family protein [Burkholderiaceae bacterium]|nr:acyl-CoA dehydrogenase family protein [Burkholderiaceae bacterium]
MNDVKARARALVPEIVSRRDEIERARRIPADLNARLVQAGLLRMLVPAEIGGLEMAPLDYVEVIELLGEADASTGWCTMIAAVTCLKSAFLDREVARALYGDPAAVHGGVFAPNGRADVDGDHYVVNGDWQWASGSANCTWLTGGALVYEVGQLQKLPNGAPDARQFLFPADAVELADDWNVSGLCGTGSGSMKVRNCRVPRSHAVSLVTDRQQFGGPLYVFPSFGMLALGISVVAMGNASGAVNDLIALAAEKTPQGTRRVLAQRAHTQIEVARAVAMLRSARAYLIDTIGTAWDEARNDGAISVRARAELRLACTHVARTSAEVCKTMYELGGGSSLFLASPLQRRLRDAMAASQHMMVAPPTLELTGRVLLGVETDLTFL